jgi:hypothetical protein
LVGLESLRVAFYVADTSDLLGFNTFRERAGPRHARTGDDVLRRRVAWRGVGLELERSGLELERSERLGADAVRVAALMLPGENTSLSCRAD